MEKDKGLKDKIAGMFGRGSGEALDPSPAKVDVEIPKAPVVVLEEGAPWLILEAKFQTPTSPPEFTFKGPWDGKRTKMIIAKIFKAYRVHMKEMREEENVKSV